MRSIFLLLEIDLKAPDHTTLSRPSMTLKALPRQCALPAGALHLLIESTGHIEASVLTGQDVDDPSQVGPLLDQIEHEVTSVTADGAYDGEPTYGRIAQRDTQIDVIIAPRVTAQPSAQFEAAPTTRDNHLLMIQSLGRLEWQEAYGYGKRALVKTTMGRFKAIIGPKLRARDPRGQQAKANAAVAVLNRMLSAGRPNSVRTSAAAV